MGTEIRAGSVRGKMCDGCDPNNGGVCLNFSVDFSVSAPRALFLLLHTI